MAFEGATMPVTTPRRALTCSTSRCGPAGPRFRERMDVIGRDAGDDARTIHQRALTKPVVGAAAPPSVKL
jgi:hypothetical protein